MRSLGRSPQPPKANGGSGAEPPGATAIFQLFSKNTHFQAYFGRNLCLNKVCCCTSKACVPGPCSHLPFPRGVARWVKWGHAPRGAGLGGASTQFFSQLKVFLSRNLYQNVPKNTYVLEKAVKIAAASGALLRTLGGSDPRPPRCYSRQMLQHFVECGSRAKRVLFRSEKEQNVPSAHLLFRLFSLQTLQFC